MMRGIKQRSKAPGRRQVREKRHYEADSDIPIGRIPIKRPRHKERDADRKRRQPPWI